MKNPNHPGDLIRDSLDELKTTVTSAAEALGVTRATLSRILNRKASVSPEMAVRLEKTIGSTAGFWLRLQLNYESCANTGSSREDPRTETAYSDASSHTVEGSHLSLRDLSLCWMRTWQRRKT